MSARLCFKCEKQATMMLATNPYTEDFPLPTCRRHAPAGAVKIPRVGPRMLLALAWVDKYPGQTKMAAVVSGAMCPSVGKGYQSIDRLLRAGMLVDEGRRNRAALRITDRGQSILYLTRVS